jgi:hypothetical protein
MPKIEKRLDQIIPKIQSEAFIQNKGLGNEIGFYIFDYDPGDELLVRDYVQHIKKEFNHAGSNRRIIEYDLFQILLDIARDKNILHQIAGMEGKKGRDRLLEALAKVAGPEVCIAKMQYEQKTGDVVFITGVGKVYPFMRSHNILNNLLHVLDRVPVIMFFPGSYDGQSLKLFKRFNDDNYYRAFQLIK